MDPAPRPEDHSPPRRTPALEARIYGPDALPLAAALRSALPPALVPLVDELMGAVEGFVSEDMSNTQARHWARIVAHLPGLAPALAILDAHALDGGTISPCAACETVSAHPPATPPC